MSIRESQNWIERGMEILLVEDNSGDTRLIRQAIADKLLPVTLRVARDGEQALLMLSDARFHPALIILDLNIPRIPGMDLLERWRSLKTPIVVFSSAETAIERPKVLELGAKDFVQKPLDIDLFTTAVFDIISRYAESRDETDAGT